MRGANLVESGVWPALREKMATNDKRLGASVPVPETSKDEDN